jgi:hypothetical protein
MLTAVTGDIYNNIHEQNVSTHVLSAPEVNIDMSLCTRDNRCQGPFTCCRQLPGFTKIRMFLYARIYWLAEFGDVSCLQFNYPRVETLTPTWEDFVGQFGRGQGPTQLLALEDYKIGPQICYESLYPDFSTIRIFAISASD